MPNQYMDFKQGIKERNKIIRSTVKSGLRKLWKDWDLGSQESKLMMLPHMQLLHMDMVNNVILLSLQTIFLINPNYSATHNINAHGLLVLALLMRAV